MTTQDSVGMTIFKIFMSIALILGASLCSGLNLGILALDKLKLNALLQSGSEKEKKYVKKVLPLLKDRHLLIASILLGNCLCCEILPELLDDLIGKIITMFLSVTVIVIFCEIVPQALMIKYGVRLCGKLSWFVWVLIYIFFIVAFPLARLLDCILGKEHEEHYSREELQELLAMHATKQWKPQQNNPEPVIPTEVDIFQHENQIQTQSQSLMRQKSSYKSMQKLHKKINQNIENDTDRLNYNEVSIIQGIFLIHDKTVSDVVRPLDQTFMLEQNQMLNRQTYEEIYRLGYSRIPIYFKERQNMIGVLMTKQLITADCDKEVKVSDLNISTSYPSFSENHSLADALREFKKGKSHIAPVMSKTTCSMIGIITMEDVLKQLLQEEIYDESDTRRLLHTKRVQPKKAREISGQKEA